MIRRQYFTTLIALLIVAVSVLLGPVATTSTQIQQPGSATSDERDRGLQLYQNGDAKGAIEALRIAVKRQKDDISAWHYLGLAYERLGRMGNARNAHEKAAKTADALLTSSPGHAVVIPRTQLVEAADSADQYLVLSANPSKKKKEEWHDRAEFLRVFAADIDPRVKTYSAKDVTTRPRVLEKPEPQYTEEARRHQITGTVVLRCVFAADGRVRNIIPVRALPYGLTRKAINAAYQIKFIPATKDGRPVSMYMQLEYNFNLY